MLAAPVIDENRVFNGMSDIELCAYLLRLLSIPGGIQKNADFEIYRYFLNLECGQRGFEHRIHKHSIRVMARFATLNQLRQTLVTRPSYSAKSLPRAPIFVI